ncbi:MAG: hypothetical protein QM757_26080 [Paludibaculum sp.]
MAEQAGSGWASSGEFLESMIECLGRDLAYLRGPDQLRYGSADIETGALRVRVGRRPIALNVATLYRRRGRPVPEEYLVYEGHNIWLLNHSVGILRDRGALDASHVHYEMEFANEQAVITEILPQPRFLRTGSAGHRCEAEIRLNGRAVPAEEETVVGPTENLFFGAQMQMLAGDATVGRVSFPVLTPNLQASGAGDSTGQWILERAGEPISGDQTMMELVLLDRHVKRLKCRVRVSASMTTVFGFPKRVRADWLDLDVELI